MCPSQVVRVEDLSPTKGKGLKWFGSGYRLTLLPLGSSLVCRERRVDPKTYLGPSVTFPSTSRVVSG